MKFEFKDLLQVTTTWKVFLMYWMSIVFSSEDDVHSEGIFRQSLRIWLVHFLILNKIFSRAIPIFRKENFSFTSYRIVDQNNLKLRKSNSCFRIVFFCPRWTCLRQIFTLCSYYITHLFFFSLRNRSRWTVCYSIWKFTKWKSTWKVVKKILACLCCWVRAEKTRRKGWNRLE